MTTETTETNDSQRQAEAQVASIILLMDAYEAANDNEPDFFTRDIISELDSAGVNIEDFDPDDFTSFDPSPRLMGTLADNIQQTISNYPLEVTIRTDWHAVGAEDSKPTHYQILLSTGGPATRIVGELSQYGEAVTAAIEHQDWFTPWLAFGITAGVEATLTRFAQQFYFGD